MWTWWALLDSPLIPSCVIHLAAIFIQVVTNATLILSFAMGSLCPPLIAIRDHYLAFTPDAFHNNPSFGSLGFEREDWMQKGKEEGEEWLLSGPQLCSLLFLRFPIVWDSFTCAICTRDLRVYCPSSMCLRSQILHSIVSNLYIQAVMTENRTLDLGLVIETNSVPTTSFPCQWGDR